MNRDALAIGHGLEKNIPFLIQHLYASNPSGAAFDPAERPFIDLERTADPVIEDLTVEIASLATAFPDSVINAQPVRVSTTVERVDDSGLRMLANAPIASPEPPASLIRPIKRAKTGPKSRRAPVSGVPLPKSRPAPGQRGEVTKVRADDLMPLPPSPRRLPAPGTPRTSAPADETRLPSGGSGLAATFLPLPAPRATALSDRDINKPVISNVPEEPPEALSESKPVVTAPATPATSEEPAKKAQTQVQAASAPADTATTPARVETEETVIATAPAGLEITPPKRGVLPKVRKMPNTSSRRRPVVKPDASEDASTLDAPALIGVLNIQSQRQAILRLPGGRFRRVKIGDEIDGWKVGAITPDSLRLDLDQNSITLPLVPR